jgi:hypothetical protein
LRLVHDARAGVEYRELCFERSDALQFASALGAQFHRARSGLLDRVEQSRAIIDVAIPVCHCGATIEHTRSAVHPFADHRHASPVPGSMAVVRASFRSEHDTHASAKFSSDVTPPAA